MGYGNNGGYQFGPNGLQMPNDEGYLQSINPNGMMGAGMGMMGGGGQFKNFNKAMGTPLGRIGSNAIMGILGGQDPGKALMGAGMDFGKSALMKYGTKQLLGGALGGQAAGFLGGPWGMAAMAAMPFLSKGFSSLGRSLGIGKRSGPSAQELAMGEAKGNLMGMRGTYGADMGVKHSAISTTQCSKRRLAECKNLLIEDYRPNTTLDRWLEPRLIQKTLDARLRPG